MADRVQPHDAAAEQALVGALLLGSASVDPEAVRAIVAPEDCYDPRLCEILTAAFELQAEGTRPDLVTVRGVLARKNRLQSVGGAGSLATLVDRVPSSAAVEDYARIVRDLAAVRRLQDACQEVRHKAYGVRGSVREFLDESEATLLSASRRDESHPVLSAKEAVVGALDLLQRTSEKGGGVTGVATGLRILDDMTGGLHGGQLVIVAGRPGSGKSALAVGIALNAAMRLGVGALFFSLEMQANELIWRVWGHEAGVSVESIKTAKLSQTEFEGILAASTAISRSPLWLDPTGALPVLELRAKARRWRKQHSVGLIVVDYLQLVRPAPVRGQSREQEVASVSAALKALAKELDVPVVALCQLNRKVEERGDKRPLMADLRESGAIEQDADVIVFVYRDEQYDKETQDRGVAELVIGKQRHGPCGTARVAFHGPTSRFSNLAEGYA